MALLGTFVDRGNGVLLGPLEKVIAYKELIVLL